MKKPVQTLRLETRSNLDSLDHFIVVDAKPKLSFKYMLDGVTVVEKSAYDSLATDHERLLAERDATIAELTARLRGGMQLCSFRLSNWDKSEVKLAQAGETIADLKARLKLNQSISKENFDLAAEKDITITNQARLLAERAVTNCGVCGSTEVHDESASELVQTIARQARELEHARLVIEKLREQRDHFINDKWVELHNRPDTAKILINDFNAELDEIAKLEGGKHEG